MKTGFILPNSEKIEFEYKDLGMMIKRFVEPYKESDEYKNFIKEYSYINPDYYYLILKKGFQVINPFMKENTIAKGHGSLIRIKNNETKKSEFYITPTTEHLKIKKFNSNDLIDGIISPEGIVMSTLDTIEGLEMGHPKISDCIINDYIIKNPSIYDEYMKNYDKENNLNYGTIFLINNLGFIICDIYETNIGYVTYNSDKANQNIINGIAYNGSSVTLTFDDCSDLSKTK